MSPEEALRRNLDAITAFKRPQLVITRHGRTTEFYEESEDETDGISEVTMNRASTRDDAKDARQEARLREVEAAVKSLRTGSVTIHVSDGKIRDVDVTTRRKLDRE